MENTQNELNLSKEDYIKGNLRVQKTAYIRQQMERQRMAEDERLERLLQEQEVIEELRESIDGSMRQTEETRKYNREFQEHLNMQVYKAHGITEDKLMGMREYRNALYRGAAAVLFLLSLALIILCGVLHGFESDVCLLMFFYTAVEGALTGRKQKPALDVICRILYILVFPTMLVMFVCYELGYGAYGLFLPYAAILGGFVTVLGTVSYFLQDPYRREKKKMLEAKNQIREIEKTAEKEIRKNHKRREKEERKEQRHLKREKCEDQNTLEKAEGTKGQPVKGAEKERGLFARFSKEDSQAVRMEPEETAQNEEAQEEEVLIGDNNDECQGKDI